MAVIGIALTGSFCSLKKVFPPLEELAKKHTLIPIVSERVAATDTRFLPAAETMETLTRICGRRPFCTIPECEPIGPKKLLDLLVICPCTGNTLAKTALGVTDSAVAMAYKSHRRNRGKVLFGVSTNDGLATSLCNIGALMPRSEHYFIPFSQDDPVEKPASLVCDFSLLPEAAEAALKGEQLQPVVH